MPLLLLAVITDRPSVILDVPEPVIPLLPLPLNVLLSIETTSGDALDPLLTYIPSEVFSLATLLTMATLLLHHH